VALGVGYALGTPQWNNPDEPAHYNYIRHIATTGQLPILQMGDYNFAELEQLKAARFPDSMSIAGVRYEYHQPPLYYLLGAAIYKATESLPLSTQVLILRLFSVALGVALLLVAYATAREVFPGDQALALASVAFVAFVPMHTAMTAAINNDTLAELILALLVWLSLRRLRDADPLRRYVLLAGLLLGLGLLTKVTVYMGAVVLLAAEVGRKPVRSWRPDRFVAIFALSLLLSLWWFARNAVVYGHLDLTGRLRHDAVVVGQPRTVLGLEAARHFVVVTFQSFWAQFGWMGILVDQRIYLLLAVLTGLAALGLVLWAIQQLPRLPARQKWALGLLALTFLLILAGMLQYNLTFIQAQGRYLFPAIVPIAIFFVLGLRELASRRWLLPATLGVGLAAVYVVVRGRILLASSALLVLLAGVAQWLLAKVYDVVVLAALTLALLGLDFICLTRFVIPYFR
jgi:4-amino-4-deoxy-L-arabinose transferase-like glycosyltransferase